MSFRLDIDAHQGPQPPDRPELRHANRAGPAPQHLADFHASQTRQAQIDDLPFARGQLIERRLQGLAAFRGNGVLFE
jgi:hypothetical protein